MSGKGIIITLAVIAAFMLAVALIAAVRADRLPDYSRDGSANVNQPEVELTRDLDLIKMQWKTGQPGEENKMKKTPVAGSPAETGIDFGENGKTD